MAEVTSYTAERILELLSELSGIAGQQEVLNTMVTDLKTALDTNVAVIAELQDQTMPALQQTLAENNIRVSELNDTTLVDLQTSLEQSAAQLQDLQTVTIPSLEQDLSNTMTNVLAKPEVYVQDIAPEDPDDLGRDLLVGDSWFDSSDNDKQYFWNGAAWSTFSADVPDLSLTVQKFKTPTHMIYIPENGIPSQSQDVTFGANVSAASG